MALRGGKTGDSKTNYDTNAVMLVRPWIKTMTEEMKRRGRKGKKAGKCLWGGLQGTEEVGYFLHWQCLCLSMCMWIFV